MASQISHNTDFIIGEYSENKDHFYQYILLKDDAISQYDSNVNYGALLEREKSLILNKLLSNWQNFNNALEESSSFPKDIFEYWYLFKENPGKNPGFAKMIHEYLENKHSVLREAQYYVQAGYMHRIFNNSKYITVDGFGIENNALDIARVKDDKNFSILFQYKYFIREISEPFSFIKLGLLLNFTELSLGEFKSSYYTRYNIKDEKNFTSEYYNFTDYDFEDKYKFGIFIKASTPLFILWNDFYLEAGFMTGVERNYTKLNYTFNHIGINVTHNGYSYSNTQFLEEKNVTVSKTVSKNFYYFSPMVTMTISPLKYLAVEFFSCYNAIGLNFGVAF